MSLNGFIRLRISNQMTQHTTPYKHWPRGPGARGLQHAGAAVDWVVCWNRVMACGISNQYFLSFITVTWTAHSILIENNLIKNLTVKRDWELWMRLLVRIHQLGLQLHISWSAYISWSCSCTSAGLQLSPGISELVAAQASSCRGGHS